LEEPSSTFTCYLNTCLQETGLNHTKNFLNEVTVGSHIVKEVSRDNLGEA